MFDIEHTTEVRIVGPWKPLAEIPLEFVRLEIVDEIESAICRDMRREEPTQNTDSAGSVVVGDVVYEYRR